MDDPATTADDLAPGFRAAWPTAPTPPLLPDSPVFPLARTVQMPPGHPYPSGAVGLQWTDLSVEGLGKLVAAARLSAWRWRLTIGGVRLAGQCRLEAKPDPVIDLDTGGNLQELPPTATQPLAAGGGGDAPDPATEQWLDTARAQRARLGATENGLQLIALYNQHNEVYADVFNTSQTLPTIWKAQGATRAMAADTNDALATGGVINQPDKLYANGLTYNHNAFVQQLAVSVATLLKVPGLSLYQPLEQQNPSGPYWEASKAALSFGKGVTDSTGNSKTQVTPLVSDGVYQAVNAPSAALPEVSDEEAKALLGSAMSGGSGGGGPAGPGWLVIDEDDRQLVRFMVEQRLKELAEDPRTPGDTLFLGALRADLGEIHAEVELTRGPDGVRAVAVEVELPAFALDIDDAGWSGAVAAVARERLARVFFLRNLLTDSLRERLVALLGEAAARAHSIAAGLA